MISYYEKQIEELDSSDDKSSIPRTASDIQKFNKKLRHERYKFERELRKPKLPLTEIKKGMDNLEDEEKVEREKVEKAEIEKEKELKGGDFERFHEKTKEKLQDISKRYSKKRKKLLESSLSPKDIIQKFNEFLEIQTNQRNKFYGVDSEKESEERKSERNEKRKVLLARISDIKSGMKKQTLHYELRLQEVSKTYWAVITGIFYLLIQQGQDTPLKIKTVIAQAELGLGKKTDCKQLFNDQKTDCIAVALLNLMIKIERFKYEYAEDLPLSEDDVKLASSIILNKSLTDKNIFEVESKKSLSNLSEEKEKDEDSTPYEDGNGEEFGEDEKEIEQFQEEEVEEMEEKEFAESNEEIEIGMGDYAGDLYDEDEPAGFGFCGSNPESHLEIATFGFEKKIIKLNEDNIAIIENQLKIVSKDDTTNLREVANYFIRMINVINNYPMSEKIKQNRINFFATK